MATNVGDTIKYTFGGKSYKGIVEKVNQKTFRVRSGKITRRVPKMVEEKTIKREKVVGKNYSTMAKHIQMNNEFNDRVQQVIVSGKGQPFNRNEGEIKYVWDGLHLYRGSSWSNKEQKMVGGKKVGTYKSIPNLHKWQEVELHKYNPVTIKKNDKQLKLFISRTTTD